MIYNIHRIYVGKKVSSRNSRNHSNHIISVRQQAYRYTEQHSGKCTCVYLSPDLVLCMDTLDIETGIHS